MSEKKNSDIIKQEAPVKKIPHLRNLTKTLSALEEIY